MEKKCAIILIAVLAATVAITETLKAATVQPPIDPAPGYKWQLVFEDTFSGTELDASKWSYNYPWGSYHIHRANMQPEQVTVENGELVIKAIDQRTITDPWCVESEEFDECVDLDYTSGAIHTRNKFWFRQGYLEARFKIPQQQSTWPSLWMLEQEKPAEIDTLATADRYGPDWEESPNYSRQTEPLAGNYHTYGMHWMDDGIDWYLDGEKTYGFGDSASLSNIENGVFLIIDLPVGGWADDPGDETYPAEMKCDYIRVWQQVPIEQAPWAYWTLDEDDFQGGQYLDSSGQERHATPDNVPPADAFVDGVVNEGLNLADYPDAAAKAGTDSPAAQGTPGEMTVSLWVKWDGPTGEWQGLVSKRQADQGAEWFFQINPDGQWLNVNHWSSPSELVAEPPAVGQWVHFAFTVDQNGARLYRDGLLDATEPAFSLGQGIEAELVIGGVFVDSDGKTGSPFNGVIDEIRIFDYALSGVAISEIVYQDSGTKVCSEEIRPEMDFTGDCKVGFADYAMLAQYWFYEGTGMPE